MKTAFPVKYFPRSSRRALTILEMLVSVALLSVIIVGLTLMFVQTQKAFKLGIKQSDMTDAGRTVIEMITADLSQLSDAHFTNQSGVQIFACPNFQISPAMTLIQSNLENGVLTPFRTNQMQDVFALVQTNSVWTGIGYTVSNWFTNTGGVFAPGAGTLYRYTYSTNAPLTIQNFSNMFVFGYQSAIGSGTFTNCHRVADGIVHLKIYAYDAGGNECPYAENFDLSTDFRSVLRYPMMATNFLPLTNTISTNYLPHSLDIELGILEPETIEHAKALFASGATPAAAAYLQNAGAQVQIFRQHIIIPAAP